MKKLLLRRFLPVLLCGMAGLCSCVDKNYDLGDVNTDEITVGQAVVGPLGTGIISADKILDVENVEEIGVDARGNYVARYAGNLDIQPASVPGIIDKSFVMPDAGVVLPWGAGTTVVSAPVVIPASQTSASIYPEATAEVSRIDSILFNTGAQESLLAVDVALSGFGVTGGEAELGLTLEFPAGYDLRPYDVPAGTTFSNGRLSCVAKLVDAGSLRFVLQTSRIAPGAGDMIVCNSQLTFYVGDVVSVNGSPALKVSGGFENMDYKVIYGAFDGQFSTDAISIDMRGFDNIFTGDDNMLSFVGSYVKLQTQSNIGIPFDAVITLDAQNQNNGSAVSTQINGIKIKAPADYPQIQDGKIWIGSDESQKEEGYEFIRNNDLAGLLKISPTQIELSADINTGVQIPMFYPRDAASAIGYEVVVPLAPAADFKAAFDQKMDDIFDEDILSYLFTSGTVELYGTAENGMPLDLLLDLIITDANDRPVGIELPGQNVAGCTATGTPTTSALSFLIKESDMPKMNNARNILLRFTASGNARTEGLALRPEQEVKLDLKFRKTGGITISSND